MTDRELLKQACDALERSWAPIYLGANGQLSTGDDAMRLEVIAAIKAELAKPEPRCKCGDRAASACPGAWEEGCDLGANEAHVVTAGLLPHIQAILADPKSQPAEPADPVAWHYVAGSDVPHTETAKPAEPAQAEIDSLSAEVLLLQDLLDQEASDARADARAAAETINGLRSEIADHIRRSDSMESELEGLRAEVGRLRKVLTDARDKVEWVGCAIRPATLLVERDACLARIDDALRGTEG